MKIQDLSPLENNENLKLDANGDILCRKCLTRLAIVSRHGMLRDCEECQKIKETTFIASIDEPNGRRSY